MASRKRQEEQERRRPSPSFEDRENQMIHLAVGLAEKQLLAGTASAQTINHYLKLGSTREVLEKQRLRRENELLNAKVEALSDQKDVKQMLDQAINAMGIYSGQLDEEDDYYAD